MKTAKYLGDGTKKKTARKTHITKEEYNKTTAASVDKSLEALFGKSAGKLTHKEAI